MIKGWHLWFRRKTFGRCTYLWTIVHTHTQARKHIYQYICLSKEDKGKRNTNNSLIERNDT